MADDDTPSGTDRLPRLRLVKKKTGRSGRARKEAAQPDSNEHHHERMRSALEDDFDEELEMQLEEDRLDELADEQLGRDGSNRLDRKIYFDELFRLQRELVRLQDWIAYKKLKVLVIFEGRDSAGKGGAIKRITARLNPRVCRVVALPTPTEKEKGQWYFQRYVPHLPSPGELVLFDRSWYNRAGVERVMGFASKEEVEEFFRSVPEFERMLVRSGIILLKYWFSITDEEQAFRFKMRIVDPLKQWKLSPMDMQSRVHWEDYTKAKEEMLQRTHAPETPWWVVKAVDKKRARLNMISHLLSEIPYQDVEHPEVELPPRVHHPDYKRHPVPPELYVPQKW
jgi:polyphosphate kinase 2